MQRDVLSRKVEKKDGKFVISSEIQETMTLEEVNANIKIFLAQEEDIKNRISALQKQLEIAEEGRKSLEKALS